MLIFGTTASVTGYTLSIVMIYLWYVFVLIGAIVTYIRAPKPHTRGLIGIGLIVLVPILFFTLKALWPGRMPIPFYLNGPPMVALALTAAIYYLLVKPKTSRPGRIFWTIYLVVVVIFIALTTFSSW